MQRERAKEILELCRPDHVEDLDDSIIAEALEQLDQDSELSVWFEEQQIQDEAIRTELNKIMPPAGLKQSILNEMHADSAPDETQIPEESVEPGLNKKTLPTRWFKPWMGIAALLVFSSVFLILQNRNTSPQSEDINGSSSAFTKTDAVPLEAGVPDIIQFLGQQIEEFNNSKFNKQSEQVTELKNYLKLAGAPSPAVIPEALEGLPTIGCVSFNYNGNQLSMICFKNGQVYHLITADRVDFKDSRLRDLSPTDAYFFEHRSQAFKVWPKGNQIYILITKGTKMDIPDVPEFI